MPAPTDRTPPRSRVLPRALLLALAAAAALAVGLALLSNRNGSPLRPPSGERAGTLDPLVYRSGDDEVYERRAAAGESHILFARSPGGVEATARRVDRWRAAIETAAGADDVDPDVLEAIVFLESGGRPDVIAGGDPANAAGLTQIVAETGQSLLDMHIDLAASRRLTRRYARELGRGHPVAASRALAARRRVDDRFVPPKALAATVRYLSLARRRFGRDDLATVSYHMGIGNLDGVLRAFGEAQPSYARRDFDSSPLRHAGAWTRLARFGDDSSTYYWRILAAMEIMRLHRDDPRELARLNGLQTAKGSGEEVLHPGAQTEAFTDPDAIARARDDGALVALPPAASLGMRRDARMGELAPRLEQRPALYFAARPEVVRVARYIAAGVRRISGRPEPLTMTSAVRDERYQRLLGLSNPEATHAYSLHTTGYAFDILRRYRNRAQAVALQFMLDRLQALDLIAWVREPAAIHITVGGEAASLVRRPRG
jgi:Transglycosylase SLT domain